MTPSTVTGRKFLTLSAAAAAGGLLARHAARACPALDLPPSEAARALARGVNAFGIDLQGQLAGKGNPFFSPFSVAAALAMTSAGARGETGAEMEKVLHLPQDPHPAFGDLIAHVNGTNLIRGRQHQLATANAIWAQKDYPWHKAFVELTRASYGAGLVETDFRHPEPARKEINAWVSKETREKIRELIPTGILTPATRMVLANAVYFKGDWQTKFDAKLTRGEAFTHADGRTAKAPLMHLTGEFRHADVILSGFWDSDADRAPGEPPEWHPWRCRLPNHYEVQALEMPYAGGDVSMVVFLPRDPRSIRAVAGMLTPDHFAAANGAVEWRERPVNVTLPRFTAESEFSLQTPLMNLGMVKAFGGADFTGMSPDGKSLFISHVLHKAFVEVNEEGSEAAAATAVVVARASAPPETPVEFRADRPFVYAIRDNATGALLFLGRYDGPKA